MRCWMTPVEYTCKIDEQEAMHSANESKYLTPYRSLGLSKTLKKTRSSKGSAKVGVTPKSVNSPFSSPLISEDAATCSTATKKPNGVQSTLWTTPLIRKSRLKMGLSKSSGKQSVGGALEPKTLLSRTGLSDASIENVSQPERLVQKQSVKTVTRTQSTESKKAEDMGVPLSEHIELKNNLNSITRVESLDSLTDEWQEQVDSLSTVSPTPSHNLDGTPIAGEQNDLFGGSSGGAHGFLGWDPENDKDSTILRYKMKIMKSFLRNIENSPQLPHGLETNGIQTCCSHIGKGLASSEEPDSSMDHQENLEEDSPADEVHFGSEKSENNVINTLEESLNSSTTEAAVAYVLFSSPSDDNETVVVNNEESSVESVQPETRNTAEEQCTFKTPLPRSWKTFRGKQSRKCGDVKKPRLSHSRQRLLSRLGASTASITLKETNDHQWFVAKNMVDPSTLGGLCEPDLELENDMRKWLTGGRQVIDQIIQEVRVQKDRNMTVMEVLQEHGVDPNMVGYDPDSEEFVSFERFLLKNNVA